MTEIIFKRFIIDCPQCKHYLLIDFEKEIVGHSRKWDFDGIKGDARCDNCGYFFEVITKLYYEIKNKGLACGVCEKPSKKLFDAYFCKDCYRKKLNDDLNYYQEMVQKLKLDLEENKKEKNGE